MKTTRRRLLCLSLAVLAGAAWMPTAAQDERTIAVPLYRPADVIDGLYRHWAPPRAAALVQETAGLQRTLQALCDAATGEHAHALETARAQWRQAVGAWERLAAVPFGPLIQRRSAHQIDFTPTRPRLIKRAIARAPQGAAQMELVGTPAKGLPALEWLLWTQPVQPATPACRYAVEAAADALREAQALQAEFAQTAAAEWNDADVAAAFTEFVNQWVGGLERLRWQQIERPVREHATGGGTQFPRLASGASAASWARQWAALRELAVFSGAAPQPGKGVVSLEGYLRGRGHIALADRWADAIGGGEAALRGLRPDSGTQRLLAAAQVLATAKRMAEEEVAPALQVTIGFSDSDGD